MRPPHAVADTKGRFRIAGLAKGQYTLVASAHGVGRGVRPGIAMDTKADVTLSPAGSIEGVLRGPDARPMAGVLVRLQGYGSVARTGEAPTSKSGPSRSSQLTSPGVHPKTSRRSGFI